MYEANIAKEAARVEFESENEKYNANLDDLDAKRSKWIDKRNHVLYELYKHVQTVNLEYNSARIKSGEAEKKLREDEQERKGCVEEIKRLEKNLEAGRTELIKNLEDQARRVGDELDRLQSAFDQAKQQHESFAIAYAQANDAAR